ncbi:hypothetical protein AW27_026330 [Streptomyces sp. PCS3-D2]|uniref:hypothetical protein n=1 Tax=Streptomyces sp. PCS3-D2 TaxID=1460244 RepID=UPI000AE9B2CD|nr:hypothetical protein [Streptomyces sp. PCS3-D2]WKV74725.1 hypothetical protein AW27_026330 [Streptomyces sp. PCS3-D2]
MATPEPPATTDTVLARAEAELHDTRPTYAIAWALIAIAGELATIRRDLRKRR